MNSGKFRVILKRKGVYFTRIEFGSYDEILAKYSGKAVSIKEA